MFDPTSPTWMWLEGWVASRLERMREENDAISKSPEETAALRGRIAFAKELLALPAQLRMQAEEERRVARTPPPQTYSLED